MSQTNLLKQFIGELNSLGIPYMISGAYAVSYFGLPRATHDLDIVIEIKPCDVVKICQKFKKNYIVDKGMIENAAQHGTHFSMIHSSGNLKFDLWVLKRKVSERERFNRRKKISLFEETTYIISAEDLILTKLEWFRRSKNTKHMDDAAGIIKVQAGNLDRRYLLSAVEKSGIRKYWNTAVKKQKFRSQL